ncbi:hypothetical protein [Photobacterium sanguinicancri]|uniref:hypothetical protein n=1 Tax=Photobacterium sanguinicancri TaxID=875932 RepID=UPI000787410F|nr:hypothetical protein [Photobacterium sanguinicancri]KXI21016.1 hypothetical protein AS132_23165 [Photobacterium sanguinicancri]
MKIKETLIAFGMTSLLVMIINIVLNSTILVVVWNGLVSSIHSDLPDLSFFNAVGVIAVTYIVRGKFSIKESISN